MDVYVLSVKKNSSHYEGSAWDPWFDKVFDVAVFATSESHARDVVAGLSNKKLHPSGDCWRDPDLVDVERVDPDADDSDGLILVNTWNA